MAMTAALGAAPRPMTREERKVIIASSVGTVFEWYDFYLAGSLAVNISAAFFSGVNPTAAFIFTLLGFAAGFAVRPFGALFFGSLGDLIGRKYTFLVTMTLMGISTFVVGLLPSYASIGFIAPVLFIACRLIQGLALGGEYGGAATYVAEHAPQKQRGYDTAWIQTTSTVGLFLALIVIYLCRFTGWLAPKDFTEWGWRIPFLVSLILLVFSVYIRLKLNESPVFQRMKAEGKGSKAPLRDSFLRYPNNKYVLLALLGATAGQGVVWYTGQLYALFFLVITLKLDGATTYMLIGLALLIGTPFFLVFGALSDRIGRLKIILAGCLIAAVTYFPLFKGLTHYVNPALESYQASTPINVSARDCQFHIFVGPWSTFSDCDKAQDLLTKSGLSFTFTELPAGSADTVITKIGNTELKGFDDKAYNEALKASGYPASADKAKINYPMTLLILVIMMIYVTMVYRPIAAFLVEMFPTRIRYSSMSLPYHIGNGWFGGMLPLLATALVAAKGDIYFGLWYPIIVALMSFVVGLIFLRDHKDRDIESDFNR